ncbi:spore coat protein [Bacillaceae bacterium SIJ1]|uniref:spore coat protein n=1 Tax=Litoribacterium kuwaitense TaxID=1398745 RepID=UPI0013E9BA5B|nr:spore coat protein [Litoribacterium kuwaitense]NGP46348.1 spore coat protein [Litoribacterium kuwaitense]
MQQQKIQNNESTVPKTTAMNDKDLVTDALFTEKYLTSSYDTALNEMSHAALFQAIQQIQSDTQACQRQLYDAMFQKGWYTLTPEQTQSIQASAQQFSQDKAQLPGAAF